MDIKEITSLEGMLATFPILNQMYPELDKESCKHVLTDRINNGYKMIGVFDNNQCICCAGYWVSYRFYCKRFVQLDNLITDQNHRDSGAGTLILEWIKNFAKDNHCERVLIDTYTENYAAQRLFLRKGFVIRGYHLNYYVN